jgi:uncharacterized SAM-binding protein YcdF (DUF218 family)
MLSPGNLIVLLLSLATVLLLMNKISTAKWTLLPMMLVSLTLLSYPVSGLLMAPLESRFSKPEVLPENIDGIIVLGGGEELKQSLSWSTAELGNGGDRYIAAAILAKHYPAAPVMFSGGSGLLRLQGVEKEAHIPTTLLMAVGIKQARLLIESKSRNTHENFCL